MLAMHLRPEEYFTINGNIVVQMTRITGGRCCLAIDASRDIPIVRGKVLERTRGERPACLDRPVQHREHRRNALFCWTDEREQAMRSLERLADRLEADGASEQADVLRAQLHRVWPAEEEASQ